MFIFRNSSLKCTPFLKYIFTWSHENMTLEALCNSHVTGGANLTTEFSVCQREQKCEFSVCSGIVTGARSACRSFAPVYIWEKNVHCQKTQWVNNETGKNSSKYSIQIRFSYLNRCLCQQKPKWNLSISCLMQDCQSLKLQVLCLQNGSHR